MGCNCCNGAGHEFVARGMKCKIVIRNENIMSVYLPNNATDIEVVVCPLCGRLLIPDTDKTRTKAQTSKPLG